MDDTSKITAASWRGEATLGMLARRVISAPFVYSLLLPIALLDAAVSFYQAVCFRLWRIPAVRRSAHLILDRHMLAYLNGQQKLNCLYCSYANGVLAYAVEIASRTEQYWCPIKHATDPVAPHPRYAAFIDYADSQGFKTRMSDLRAGVQAPQSDQSLQQSLQDKADALARTGAVSGPGVTRPISLRPAR